MCQSGVLCLTAVNDVTSLYRIFSALNRCVLGEGKGAYNIYSACMCMWGVGGGGE